MSGLQQERLVIAVQTVAGSRRSLDDTIAYVKEREAFGQPVARFQNTQFKLAELATEVEIGQAFVDKLLAAHVFAAGIARTVVVRTSSPK
jgi:acyl-CoA dehydrogenase